MLSVQWMKPVAGTALAKRLAHGLPSAVHNNRFHHVHIGRCGQVDGQRYGDLHEKSLLVISFRHPPPS
jgi:hypothetical protein